MMDFVQLLSQCKSKACVISVERLREGDYGNIRIVAGNRAHCEDMEKTIGHPFIPGSPYEQYFPKDKNFEDYCYRSAFLGQSLHTYVPLPQMGLWLNMFLIPMESDRENVGYCTYVYDVTPEADPDQRASLSADISAAVLKICIKLRGAGDVRQAFREVIEDVRKSCDSDYCCILLTDAQTKSCFALCEAIKPGSGLQSMEAYLDETFYDVTQTWNDTIGDSTCVILKDARDMEWLRGVNPVWHKSLTSAGAKSIVLFPLKHNGTTLGYVWALNFNVDATVRIKEILELTTFFVASEIANYQLLQKLEILSSVDLLTGVKNRNKMNTFVDDVLCGRIEVESPYAVIFADLNGLKQVNDVKGHGAGDRILKEAAGILREVFPDGEVYRAGGDEFMIVVMGMDEKTVEERRQRIKELAAGVEGLYFAIGTHVVRGSEDIRLAMREADQGMYADKKEYYLTHPDRRYR